MFRLLNIWVSGLTFAAYSASYVSPFSYWPLAFLGLLYPWLALINVFFILYWLPGKRRIWALLSLLTLLAGWGHLQGLIGFHGQDPKGDGHSQLRILSYNVRMFQPYHAKSVQMIEPPEWKSSLDRYRPDILCMQEYDHGPAFNTTELCRKAGMVHHVRKNGGELAIFSKNPILNASTHMFSKMYGFQFADIRYGEKTVRIYNVHLQSNSITGIAARVVEKGSLREKSTWRDIRGMLSRYRRAARIREEQAAVIARHIRSSPYPVVLCGDLNDVPQSYVYHQIGANLQDAFRVRGKGLGTTYAGPIPGLRIDVVLADPRLKVLSCRIGKAEFSDHRPILAVIGWE